MVDEILYGLGVDFDSSMTFEDGDILLKRYNDNLGQAVANRLNTDLNELDWFYYDYGSILQSFLGWKANDTTLAFIKSEISNVLKNEPRLVGFSVDVKYTDTGSVGIDLTLYPTVDIVVPVNLVLTTTGVVEIETDEIKIGSEE